ncbi:MAG: HD domain-containing protein [Candidatus Omnitrophica bacterium]|nr:HD domain-containing protein [Candidatus Omnitrophota bacterium]
MNKKFISDLKTDEQFESVFLLSQKSRKLTKHDKPYLEILLADKSGKIEGRVWDNADEFNANVREGDIVKVKGAVVSYRDIKQVKVDGLVKASPGEYSHTDMIRALENIGAIIEKISAYFRKIKDPWIKKLADDILGDDDMMARFAEGAGAKNWHNAYVGGLAEHTYEVMFIADSMSELYPEADADILLMGSFLHDIGKIFEINSKKMDYTIEGSLLGHITIGHKIFVEKANAIQGFPEDTKLHLEHIILSHHGEYEQQSPVLPKTLEANIIYHSDNLVSQANAIREIRRAQSDGEKVWSDFVSIKNRRFYLKTGKATPPERIL